MQAKPTQRVYAFIDSQNLNVSVQKLGWKLDWHKFRNFLADTYHVSKAYMFIGYVPEFENLYEQMHNSGYLVVLKPTFDMTKPRIGNEEGRIENEEKNRNEEEKKPVKGNIDAELVLWAMKEINNYDQAIIVSGDGDFYCLVEYLEERQKLLKVLAPSAHYSSLYNRYESYVIRIDQFRARLAYHDKKRFKKN